ncbi:hypothetical protein COT75_00565 [Candidatus Beckwithbacteria bacterium CG10_big_fil_rev_8_21_14_0_10_34_10]|uniref:Uncharacterized protein n=1 Tax=Candidatus Beckwithbacteria bacterium CG10_big_fil_rev_8_21_14_0_10_34_10 TaxID=1974495 RepID=A0A2H0WAT9_9BACT|nr:MAG: hypothetical protein COT75_00565 [Candidatus Beckwithbacteria bacterium CG10_big_fil_rev_8_21_14_0_10_34_10]
MKEINFLKDRLDALAKKEKRLLIIRIWSFGALGIYGLLVLSLFSYNLLMKRQSKVLGEKIIKEKAAIEELKSIETKQVYLSHKTQSLAQILSSKRQNQEIVETFISLLPEGISVSNFNIDEQGRISFSGHCQSFYTLKHFLAVLSDEVEDLPLAIKESNINNINYGFGDGYSFSATILFYLGEKQ